MCDEHNVLWYNRHVFENHGQADIYQQQVPLIYRFTSNGEEQCPRCTHENFPFRCGSHVALSLVFGDDSSRSTGQARPFLWQQTRKNPIDTRRCTGQEQTDVSFHRLRAYDPRKNALSARRMERSTSSEHAFGRSDRISGVLSLDHLDEPLDIKMRDVATEPEWSTVKIKRDWL